MNEFDFKQHVISSVARINDKLDVLLISTTQNKTKMKWITLQLYCLWVVAGTATMGVIKFLYDQKS